MSSRKILISGAGVGGLTLAYFLHRNGFSPVIIERSVALRDNGYMIDFFSSGITVAKKMGIISDLEQRDIPFYLINQLNEKGEKDLKLDMTGFRKSLKGKVFNFIRTDLVNVIFEKIKAHVEIRFNTSIDEIFQDENSVSVKFNDGTEETFDMLVGADGLNSNVRDIIYDDKEVEKIYLGYYVCALEHSIPLKVSKGEALSMICPRKQIMSYETEKGVSNSLFVFKSPMLKRLNTNEEVNILKKEFSDFVSPVPEIIEEAGKRNKLFFDQVTQIRINGPWHKGRVVLLGDAAYCITLLSGQGASMAMTGAYILSDKLKKHNNDYRKAFTEFESDLRPTIGKMQRKAVKNAATYLPDNSFALKIRNLLAPLFFTKLFSPLVIRQLGAQNYFEKNNYN